MIEILRLNKKNNYLNAGLSNLRPLNTRKFLLKYLSYLISECLGFNKSEISDISWAPGGTALPYRTTAGKRPLRVRVYKILVVPFSINMFYSFYRNIICVYRRFLLLYKLKSCKIETGVFSIYSVFEIFRN